MLQFLLTFLEREIESNPVLLDELMALLLKGGHLPPAAGQALADAIKLEQIYAAKKPGNITFQPDDGSPATVIDHYAP